MSKLKKIEKFYNWLCEPCPLLIDITCGVLVILFIITIITLFGSFVWWMFGWYLIPILFISLIIILGVHLMFAKRSEGGIKGWWKDRP